MFNESFSLSLLTKNIFFLEIKVKKILDFIKNHRIIKTLLLIGVTAIVLITVLMYGLDVYTHHGEGIPVPNVKNLQLSDAERILSRQNLRYEVIDSVYISGARPGAIVEQIPEESSKVKQNRIIFLTLNAYSPRMITCPEVRDMSQRQATAILEGLGFKSVVINYINSEFKDLVMGMSYQGREIYKGDKIPASSTVVLSVGNGDTTIENDSLFLNTVNNPEESETSWFE